MAEWPPKNGVIPTQCITFLGKSRLTEPANHLSQPPIPVTAEHFPTISLSLSLPCPVPHDQLLKPKQNLSSTKRTEFCLRPESHQAHLPFTPHAPPQQGSLLWNIHDSVPTSLPATLTSAIHRLNAIFTATKPPIYTTLPHTEPHVCDREREREREGTSSPIHHSPLISKIHDYHLTITYMLPWENWGCE